MRDVLFWDVINDIKFIQRSDMKTKETIKFEGKTYPLIKIDKLDLKIFNLN